MVNILSIPMMSTVLLICAGVAAITIIGFVWLVAFGGYWANEYKNYNNHR